MIERASALSGFLAEAVRESVVRLRDPGFDEGVFTGFFISPVGHLVTAFHAVKAHLHRTPGSFPLDVQFAGGLDVSGIEARHEPGWADREADWALLHLDLDPPGYLPLAESDVLTGPGADCAPVRVYGFTVADQGRAGLGAISGEFLRTVPQRRRFRIAFSVRSQGQSGGPVVDLRSHTVVGSVVGFREDERLTADAALVDRGVLAGVGLALDLAELARRWRRRAVAHLASTNPELSRLAASATPPPLPEVYLADRDTVRHLRAQLRDSARSAVVLHGPSGSGKTMIAADLAAGLLRSGRVDSVYWYDFEPPPNRTIERLLRGLTLYLLEHQGVIEPIEAVLEDTFLRDPGPAIRAAIDAVRAGRHLLVFDNAHFARRDGLRDIVELLDQLLWAASQGQSQIVLTSWDRLAPQLTAPVTETTGLTPDEVTDLVRMHGLTVSDRALDWIGALGEDITCVEQFIRSADWRRAVERGDLEPAEPEDLHQHWLNRYLAQVSPAARQVLLALAVIAAPTTRSTVANTAETADFSSTLQTLRHSPPLVRSADGRLYLHSNVARSVLATTDRATLTEVRYRAAKHLRETGQLLSAARVLLDADDAAAAIELMFTHRDDILARGGGNAMRVLTQRVHDRGRVDPDWLPRLHAVIASCESIRGDYARAAHHWKVAVAGRRGTLDAAIMHNRRADSLRMASRYPEAAQEYAEAARSARGQAGAEAARELGRAQLGLAKLDRLHADYRRSRERYEQARQAFADIFDDSGTIEAVFGLGEVLRLLEDWPAALDAYRRSLALAEARDNTERQAYALWGIGEVLRLTGHYTEAERHHRSGLDLCLRVGDTRSEGWALLGLAETYRASCRNDWARESYVAAGARFESTASETEQAHALVGLAEAKRQSGELDFKLYDRVRATYETKQLRHSTVQCYQATAMALRSAGRPTAAARLLGKARRLAAKYHLEAELHRISQLSQDRSARPPVTFNYP
ncbi:trypsin-like peptidase domain-containing protein [Plantactinospora sp. CA-294935]|uniref:trypsin-like peptidase domain-containing protein n=1 Tax=Plantactinospora sp. CA-294935 TaxID=3240012 RepID=UPI003D8AC1A5